MNKYYAKDLVLSIIQDVDAEDPRNWDNLGTMICFHRRYSLGDKHDYSCSEDVHLKDYEIVIPLYLYDHSGITMNTSGFSCPWDSGQVGWIVIDADTIRKEYGVKRISKQLRTKVREVLEAEVKIYDDYLTGNVHGYKLEKVSECECCGLQSTKEIDSCWGFYGDIKDSGMLDSLPDEIKEAVTFEF